LVLKEAPAGKEIHMWDCMLKRLQRDLGGMDHLRGQCSGMIDFSVSSDMEHYVVRIEGVPGIKGTAVRNKMVTDSFIFRIDLPAEYPDHKPIVTFEEPLFHPNCWQSGMLCLDWTPSMSLRDMIIDVVKCCGVSLTRRLESGTRRMSTG
jgi:ubiquitin-protein ligase